MNVLGKCTVAWWCIHELCTPEGCLPDWCIPRALTFRYRYSGSPGRRVPSVGLFFPELFAFYLLRPWFDLICFSVVFSIFLSNFVETNNNAALCGSYTFQFSDIHYTVVYQKITLSHCFKAITKSAAIGWKESVLPPSTAQQNHIKNYIFRKNFKNKNFVKIFCETFLFFEILSLRHPGLIFFKSKRLF
jgi:hypothetical protein